MSSKTPSAAQLDQLAGDGLPGAGDPSCRALDMVRAAGRITLKIGSSLLVDSGKGGVRQAWLRALAEDIAERRGPSADPDYMAAACIAIAAPSIAVLLGSRALSKREDLRMLLRIAWTCVLRTSPRRAWLTVSMFLETACRRPRALRQALTLALMHKHFYEYVRETSRRLDALILELRKSGQVT